MNSQPSTLNSMKWRSPDRTLRLRPSVDLQIEELVLHGFAPVGRYAIGDAVERQLVRLLHEQGLPISLHSKSAVGEIKAATINVGRNAKPNAIGQQIAQAVYQGFSR